MPKSFPIRSTVVVLAVLALPLGCVWALRPVPQPESMQFVEVLEVHLPTEGDRKTFVDILRRHAERDGLSFEDVSDSWKTFPEDTRRTIYIGLWRGGPSKDLEVMADNWQHDADPWVFFSEGVEPARAKRGRDALVADLKARWPDALEVPVLPTGGAPLRQDLRHGPRGYEIDPEAAPRYGLAAKSGSELR